MSTTLYNILARKDATYKEDLIRRSIILIRNSKNERTIDKHKMFIYDSVSSIIVKNTNNFFNLVSEIEKHRLIHEKDDIVVECYIILDKCVEKFSLKNPDWKFYFYLNKSLAQGLFRLKTKTYDNKQIYSTLDFAKIDNYDKNTFSTVNNYPLFLDKNFSDKEILLMQSKISEENIADFCKKIEIARSEYYRLVASIKKKINRKYLT
jgi:hypothetical protein